MDKAKAYKAHISGVFSRASTTYDHTGPPFFSYFGERLVQYAELKRGAKVLDVACGRGAVLFPAARAVTSSGRVIGIDLSKKMIEQTQQELKELKMTNAKVQVMDAEQLEFQSSQFDYVLCGLCLFFFPDLSKALKEFWRVLKPGGYIVASTFKKQKTNAQTKEWGKLYKSFKDRIKEVPMVETPDLDTGREISEVLRQAGFIEPEIVQRRKTYYYTDEDEWWQTAWSHGYRAYLERISQEHLPEFRSRAIRIIQKQKTTRGIPLRWGLLLSKARKPSTI